MMMMMMMVLVVVLSLFASRLKSFQIWRQVEVWPMMMMMMTMTMMMKASHLGGSSFGGRPIHSLQCTAFRV